MNRSRGQVTVVVSIRGVPRREDENNSRIELRCSTVLSMPLCLDVFIGTVGSIALKGPFSILKCKQSS